MLADSDFAQGFSQYELIGTRGLEVVEGAQLRVSMPLLRLAPDAAAATDKTRALQAWTPPLYQEDAVKSVLTQRKGASLTLQSGTLQTAQNELSRVGLTLAEGSLVAVDPGQRINLAGIGQITLNGTLQAWSGRIAVTALRDTTMDEMMATGSGRSLWVGERRAGRGRARHGGQPQGPVLRPAAGWRQHHAGRRGQRRQGQRGRAGPVHRAAAGQPAGRIRRLRQPAGQRRAGAAASAGGLIAISSANGLYLDGQMIARSGGAAGGRLALGLDTPEYKSSAIQDRVKAPRDFVLSDKATAGLPAALDNPATAADKLAYGHATLGADQLEQGGFGALDLLSNGLLSFAGDVTLNLGQSLRLFSRTLAMTPDAAPTARSAGRALHHAGRRHRRQ